MHPSISFVGVVHRVIKCQISDSIPVPTEICASKASRANNRLARLEWLVGKLERHISMTHDGLEIHVSLGLFSFESRKGEVEGRSPLTIRVHSGLRNASVLGVESPNNGQYDDSFLWYWGYGGSC